MTNAEIIESLGIKLSGDAKSDNKLINELFKVGQSQKFVKFVKVGDKYEKFTISPISFECAFADKVWKQLTFGEKLQAMKWASEDYLQKNDYGTDFPEFIYFTEQNFSDKSYVALALQGKILVSLDFVNNCLGYEALIIALHESVHELDYMRAEKIMDDVLSMYIENYKSIQDINTVRAIMELPIEGKIFNVKTQQIEMVSDDLRKQILLAKNRIVTISKFKNTPKSRNEISTPSDFNKYLIADFYYVSPLESRAYNESVSIACNMAKWTQTRLPLTKEDHVALQKNIEFLTKINGRKREIQKQFKIPADFAVNMELEYLFNKLTYGTREDKYICKKHMEQRAKSIERFWDLKHGTKGKYELIQ